MKILILTSTFDLTIDYFINKFHRDAEIFRFNTDKFADYAIEITTEGWSISNRNWTLKESEISAIYYRKPSFPLLDGYDIRLHKMMQKDMLTVFQGIVDSFEGRCLSKPSILSRAENKVFQLAKAKQVGFVLPNTLITNSSMNASNFCDDYKRIIKPLSVGKIYLEKKIGIIQTNLVDENFHMENIEFSPSYFQEYIPKDYEVRATIVGDKTTTVKIQSTDKIDWRKSECINVYSIIDLPNEIDFMCKVLMKKLQLDFGAFDFIVNNGKYYFLEINPNGQWYWLEEALALKISDDIFEYLVK